MNHRYGPLGLKWGPYFILVAIVFAVVGIGKWMEVL